MAKEVVGLIKLQIRGGTANPSPPVGPALGAKGVNIMEFCKQFNARTKDKMGKLLPVIITVYTDKSFDFILKSPPSSVLIKKEANLAKASGTAGKEKIGSINMKQVKEIAKRKMQDLNTISMEKAVETIKGTARSMGIEVTDG